MLRKTALAAAATLALTITFATPASAGTTGTLVNGTRTMIYTSSTYPTITNQGPLYYGIHRKVQAFQCIRTCISTWGYSYPLAKWIPMATTGTLYLHD